MFVIQSDTEIGMHKLNDCLEKSKHVSVEYQRRWQHLSKPFLDLWCAMLQCWNTFVKEFSEQFTFNGDPLIVLRSRRPWRDMLSNEYAMCSDRAKRMDVRFYWTQYFIFVPPRTYIWFVHMFNYSAFSITTSSLMPQYYLWYYNN